METRDLKTADDGTRLTWLQAVEVVYTLQRPSIRKNVVTIEYKEKVEVSVKKMPMLGKVPKARLGSMLADVPMDGPSVANNCCKAVVMCEPMEPAARCARNPC